MTIPVREDECLAFDAFTHPNYRFKNILRAASSRIALDCYYEMGRQKIMACVNVEKWRLFQKLYKLTGLGMFYPAAPISRIRILGIWSCRMRSF